MASRLLEDHSAAWLSSGRGGSKMRGGRRRRGSRMRRSGERRPAMMAPRWALAFRRRRRASELGAQSIIVERARSRPARVSCRARAWPSRRTCRRPAAPWARAQWTSERAYLAPILQPLGLGRLPLSPSAAGGGGGAVWKKAGPLVLFGGGGSSLLLGKRPQAAPL